MSFPDPHPGLVIRYAYLWKREHDEGREEGSKDRPCAIVVSVLDDEGEQEVMVLPITHSAPQRVEDAIEIPGATKQRLGLDSERSWSVITERMSSSGRGPICAPYLDEMTRRSYTVRYRRNSLLMCAIDLSSACNETSLGRFAGRSEPRRKSIPAPPERAQSISRHRPLRGVIGTAFLCSIRNSLRSTKPGSHFDSTARLCEPSVMETSTASR